MRNEAYVTVRRMTKDERNEADGCFSTACYTMKQPGGALTQDSIDIAADTCY